MSVLSDMREAVMRSLLKAEISYNKPGFLVALYINVLFVMLIFSLSLMGKLNAEQGVYGMLSMTVSTTGVVVVLIMIARLITKRDRMHILLPVSLRVIGIVRLLVMMLFWECLALLFLISYLIIIRSHIQKDTLWVLLSLNGFVLLINALYTIARDLRYIFTGRFREIPGILILAVITIAAIFYATPRLFSGFGQYEPFRAHVIAVTFAPAGSRLLNILGCLFSFLSIVLFSSRRSFLE